MDTLRNLEPALVWHYFQAISRIPRESGNEAAVNAYIIEQARRLDLPCVSDAAGNIIIRKSGPGSPIALQAHTDMVCEKSAASTHDFSRDPLVLIRDNDWVRADGTTLGADNGIGVAAMLALMESDGLPDMEFIFTVNEETGLYGVNGLAPEAISARKLINLDSESDGVITIGCAGGRDTRIELTAATSENPAGFIGAVIKVAGLRGGHSGTDIDAGRGNAIKLLARLLWDLPCDYHLTDLDGGTKHNAIAREAQATIGLAPENLAILMRHAARMREVFSAELSEADPAICLTVDRTDCAGKSLSAPDSKRIVALLMSLPHGVMRSTVILGSPVVATSTNLAICRLEGGRLMIHTSQRSFRASEIEHISEMARAAGHLLGASSFIKHEYPGWQPDPSSPLLASAIRAYTDLFGTRPFTQVIHAGLEAGIITHRVPGMEAIAIGPEIVDAHSPSERVSVESVRRFWDFLLAILKNQS